MATYIHCNSHCLNLVIAKSCGIQGIKTALDKIKMASLFFENSPKRNGLLEIIYKCNVAGWGQSKALLGLCRTRWSMRHSAYTHFYQSFVLIIEALEVIAHGLHLDEYDEVRQLYSDWDYKSKNDASSYFKACPISTSFALFCWCTWCCHT